MTRLPAVPYCTVKGFRGCLDILRQSPPDVVDRQSLVDRGMSPHAVYPVLGALRFLGLVDDVGHLTGDVASFLDDQDVAGRRRVFDRSYVRVLADVHFPVDDREDVDRILMDRHDVAPGVAAFCSTFFLWFAAESGVPVVEARRARRGRPPAHFAQLSEVARTLLLGQATTTVASSDERQTFATADDARETPVLPGTPASLPESQSL
jgi:hypothetical protein